MNDERDDLDRAPPRPASLHASRTTSPQPLLPLGRRRVLVADDDDAFADGLAECLCLAGARVQVARSGLELVERLLRDRPYDFVVADVCMPWMNGLHAIRRARWFGLDVPVIFLSGCADPELPAWVASIGARARLLLKPFEVPTLLLTVEALLLGR